MIGFRSICFFAALLLFACVEYHPYDTRVSGEKGINARNIKRIESMCCNKQSLRFAVISDSQRWYDELYDAVRALNCYKDIDFVIHAGDLSDYGLRTEFESQREILSGLTMPYVCLIGNHDCIATGREVFSKIFGEVDFSFTAGNVRFLCLNTNALEYEHYESVPNMGFVEQAVSTFPVEAQKSVVVMHAQPLSDQMYSEQVSLLLHQQIKRLPGLQFCVHGHGHRYKEEEIFDDGVIYYQCENIGGRSFLIFTLDSDGYKCEKVLF